MVLKTFSYKSRDFFYRNVIVQPTQPTLRRTHSLFADFHPSLVANMSDNVESSEEVNNQPSPHPATTFADVSAEGAGAQTARSRDDVPSESAPNGWKDNHEKQQKWKYRFEVTVLMLATLLLATCLLQSMATSSYRILRVTAFPCAVCLAFYGYQWVFWFSDGLTRRKRAYFDVKNMLETYQPNKDTDKGRLFDPDPPTPHVMATPRNASRNGQSSQHPGIHVQRTPDDRKNFMDWRREYYENEYTRAMQIGMYRQPMFEGGTDNAGGQTTTTTPDTADVPTANEKANTPQQPEEPGPEKNQP